MRASGKHLCLEYLFERKKVIGLYVAINLIYFIIYSLYSLPGYAYYYGLELSIFLGILLMGIDYVHFRKKHRTLIQLLKSVEINQGNVVAFEGTIEQDYQNLLERLREQLMKVIQETDEQRSSQMEYLTMWTHQIKTPVAAMRLVLSGMENSSEKSALEQELFRVEEYIGMVLQYIRIDTMSSDLLLKEYDLYDMVKQAVRKYSVLFIHKHLSLELEEFQCKVITDEKWLVFVIEQVLSNALKYTRKGKIRIYVEEKKTLVIEDTGIGIRTEDIKRVFEKGYTGYNGRLDKKSTGIGMYLCKIILDRLGHKIEIESTQGVGTKVKINLEEYQLESMD